MGKFKKRGRTMKRDFKQPREDVWEPGRTRRRPEGDGYSAFVTQSDAFDEYYKTQAIVPKHEWDEFLASLRSQLPATFRINGSGKFSDELLRRLEADFLTEFKACETLEVDGEVVQAPKPLPWYPHRLAWQFSFSRQQLRRVPALAHLHEFMKRENDTGAITRQEAVSMVPPLLLDVKPHHVVLDMCAAPGSKTFQLLEMIHAEGPSATGLVIANDADTMRCNLLTHQTKRMCSANLAVTNHAAQYWPLLHLPEDQQAVASAQVAAATAAAAGAAAEGGVAAVAGKEGRYFQFDRILCDVPCSGDGTLRKAPDIWRRWSVQQGNSLHILQLRITLQACRLLKVGGRLVYSTCSLNPVENEAVVAEVLRRTGGSMRLLDVSSYLPELRRAPGLKRWKIKSQQQQWYDSWNDVPKPPKHKIEQSMFADEASDAMPLERCVRLLPHHNDTGGFFVAVMEKVSPVDVVNWPMFEGGQKIAKQQEQQRDRKQQQQEETAATAVATTDPQEEEAAAAAAAAGDPGVYAAGQEFDAGLDAADTDTAALGEEAGVAAGEEAEMEAVDGDAAGASAVANGEDAMAEEGSGGAVEGGQGGGGAAGAAGGAPAKAGARDRNQGKWKGVDPIHFIDDPEVCDPIHDYYGISKDKLPLAGRLMTRCLLPNESRPKRVYYVPDRLKELLALDQHRQKLKVTTAGLKVLERQAPKDDAALQHACCYRIVNEGLHLLLPHIRSQRVRLSADDFLALLTYRALGIFMPGYDEAKAKAQADATAAAAGGAKQAGNAAEDSAVRDQEPPAGDAAEAGEGKGDGKGDGKGGGDAKGGGKPFRPLLRDPEVLAQLEHVRVGCAVVLIKEADCERLGLASDAGQAAEAALTAAAPLAVAVWRAGGSFNLLVSKPETNQMIERLRGAMGLPPLAAAATKGGRAKGGGGVAAAAGAEQNGDVAEAAVVKEEEEAQQAVAAAEEEAAVSAGGKRGKGVGEMADADTPAAKKLCAG